MMAHHVAGVIALAAGDPAAALGELEAGVELAGKLGHGHPGAMPLLPDAIEAAAASQNIERAAELAAELDAQSVRLDSPWVRAAALRGRGVVAAADSDKSGPSTLAAAIAAFDATGHRLDAARSCWWRGRALWRTGRRQAAAAVLDEALQRFGAVAAAPWQALVTAELERVAPGHTSRVLTDDELAVASRVASGQRNREIADALFVSVATVEARLTRAYRKLGVRSRTELASRLGELSP